MTSTLIAGLCGFLGGVVAVAGVVAIFMRQLKRSDAITISRGPGPEWYKDVEVLEHARRPQGLYIRFRNCGAKPIEMAQFKVRAYKDGKLWVEFDEAVYSETQPGEEQEGILKLLDCRNPSQPLDLSNCRVEVKFLSAYVSQAPTA